MAKVVQEEIAFAPLALDKVTLRLVGLTPLLVNSSVAAVADIEKGQEKNAEGAKKVKEVKQLPSPEERIEAALYRWDFGDGPTYAFPSAGIRKAIVTAGMRFLGDKSVRLNGIIQIRDLFVPIVGSEPIMEKSFVPVPGPARKAAVSYRPRFDGWSIPVTLYLDTSQLKVEALLNMVRRAGFSVGLGSWRVERGGSYGQFTLDADSVVVEQGEAYFDLR